MVDKDEIHGDPFGLGVLATVLTPDDRRSNRRWYGHRLNIPPRGIAVDGSSEMISLLAL
jgi:hypothetical protein